LLALLAIAADAPADDTPSQTSIKNTRPAFSGYRAEVEVSLGRVTRHGLIIVTRDGSVHLEQLDEHASRWVHRVVRPESPSPMGWNDRPLRAGPVRIVWGRVGQTEVLSEIHTPDASLRVSQHRLLSTR